MTVHDPRWEQLRAEIDKIVDDARSRKITTGEAAKRIVDIQRQMQEFTRHLERNVSEPISKQHS